MEHNTPLVYDKRKLPCREQMCLKITMHHTSLALKKVAVVTTINKFCFMIIIIIFCLPFHEHDCENF